DLMVHRILRQKLLGETKSYGNTLNEICKHISSQEKKASEAERESNKFFQVKYMEGKVGEVFQGKVSGLADFGLFVKLDDSACEGMVPMSLLPDDSYYFDRERFQIKGRHTGYTFNFGDEVKVQVTRTNLQKKEIDMLIV